MSRNKMSTTCNENYFPLTELGQPHKGMNQQNGELCFDMTSFVGDHVTWPKTGPQLTFTAKYHSHACVQHIFIYEPKYNQMGK